MWQNGLANLGDASSWDCRKGIVRQGMRCRIAPDRGNPDKHGNCDRRTGSGQIPPSPAMQPPGAWSCVAHRVSDKRRLPTGHGIHQREQSRQCSQRRRWTKRHKPSTESRRRHSMSVPALQNRGRPARTKVRNSPQRAPFAPAARRPRRCIRDEPQKWLRQTRPRRRYRRLSPARERASNTQARARPHLPPESRREWIQTTSIAE